MLGRFLLLGLLALTSAPARAQVELVAAPSADAGSFVRDLTEFDGWLYFVATDQDQLRNELWRTDGATTEVFDVNPGLFDSSNPGDLTPFGGWLYFSAETPTAGRELWRADGAAVEIVADLLPGSASSSPGGFTPLGEFLYFSADSQLWRTDGTTTELVRPASGEPVYGPVPHAAFAGWLYFSRTVDGASVLWRTDGTTFEPVGDDLWSGGNPFVEFEGRLYFEAANATIGSELWRTDGAGLEQATDLRMTDFGSYPHNLTVSGGHLYFSVATGWMVGSPTHLWRTDGTTAEWIEGVKNAAFLTDVAGRLFFAAEEAGADPDTRELWQIVGDEAGLVADLYPGPRSSWPSALTAMGSTLYFSAESETTGVELWRTDGGEVTLVADVNPGPDSSYPRGLAVFDGRVYFTASSDEHDAALWRTGAVTVATDSAPAAGAALSAPYPNPFRLEASLTLKVPRSEHVRVTVYDALGRPAAVLHDGLLAADQTHRLTLSGSDLAGGVYVIRAEGTSFAASRRVTLVH